MRKWCFKIPLICKTRFFQTSNGVSWKANCIILKQTVLSKMLRYPIVTLHQNCPNKELFWSVFSVFGLNTEIYRVNLCIHYEYGKIRTKQKFVFEHIFRSNSKWNIHRILSIHYIPVYEMNTGIISRLQVYIMHGILLLLVLKSKSPAVLSKESIVLRKILCDFSPAGHSTEEKSQFIILWINDLSI